VDRNFAIASEHGDSTRSTNSPEQANKQEKRNRHFQSTPHSRIDDPDGAFEQQNYPQNQPHPSAFGRTSQAQYWDEALPLGCLLLLTAEKF
jgi:hypothetical protein